MDHFARPEDELAVAQRSGTLYRNFQGYSTHSDCDLIGLGVTSIGMVGNTYSQNHKTIPDYSRALEAERLAVWRGVVLDDDDLLRRAVITQLICHFTLDPRPLEKRFGITFSQYFATEHAELATMVRDGLVRMDDGVITVTPAGKLLVRNICMVFDKYLRTQQQKRYSKVI